MRSGKGRAKTHATLGDPDVNAMVDFRALLGPLRVVLVAICGLLSAPLAAQDAATYTVSGIEVDATAGDAVAARQAAVAEGQRAGLRRLLERLTPIGEHGRLPPVGRLPIDQYVQNFSISQEQLSATRYMAELTVTYQPQAVTDLLRASGLSFTESASAPILVLPLYQGPDGLRLWPDDNPWWAAWSETLDPNGLLRLTLPLGDLEDMTGLTAEQVAAGDRTAMMALAGRYGADEVMVARAVPDASGTAVALDVARYGESDRTGGAPQTIRAASGQNLEDLLVSAAERLQSSLSESWKSANLLSFGQSGLMVVAVPITELADWVTVNRGLEELPEVDRVDVVEFSRELVRAQIGYVGDEQGLEQALLRQGLMLSREGESWQLRPMGGSPAGSVSGRPASSLAVPR